MKSLDNGENLYINGMEMKLKVLLESSDCWNGNRAMTITEF